VEWGTQNKALNFDGRRECNFHILGGTGYGSPLII